jgi:hypothetical protein
LTLPTILSSELGDLGPTPFYQIVAKQRADGSGSSRRQRRTCGLNNGRGWHTRCPQSCFS